jgi:hypothetical protein
LKCISFVDSEVVDRECWKALVAGFLTENSGSRYMSTARGEWDQMSQTRHESTDAYAERNLRLYQGYEYVSLLVGRDASEDAFTFTTKWIDGLLPTLRPSVSLQCGENPTMYQARLAARRLEKASIPKDAKGEDEAATKALRRKISELESKVSKNKQAKKDHTDADFIALVEPLVQKRVMEIAKHLQPPFQQQMFPQQQPGFQPIAPQQSPPGFQQPTFQQPAQYQQPTQYLPPAQFVPTPPPTPPPADAQMGPPPPRTGKGVPALLQACAHKYSGRAGVCVLPGCRRSHDVPVGEIPPQGVCYQHFYGTCKRGASCKFEHNAKHPDAKN